LFTGLTPGDLDQIISISREEKYEDENIIGEGSQENRDVFVILDGSASIEMEATAFDDGSKKQVQLSTLRGGDAFGEIAFLETRHRSASVRALGEISVLRITGKRLTALFDRNHHIGYMIMKNLAGILAKRLIETNFKWRDSGPWCI